MIPIATCPRLVARRTGVRCAFTLIELMISMAVLALVLAVTLSLVTTTQDAMQRASSGSEQFRSAREAFDTVKRHVTDAMLNTYWDYDYDASGRPEQYGRHSELHFLSGRIDDLAPGVSEAGGQALFFQAPFGYTLGEAAGNAASSDPFDRLPDLLNGWGYFVDWREEENVPSFIAAQPWFDSRKRFQLVEYREPTEKLNIYQSNPSASGNPSQSDVYDWFRSGLTDDQDTRAVADHIVALVVRPLLPPLQAQNSGRPPSWIAPAYFYDSREYLWAPGTDRTDATRNQLPPLLQITMVAVDEKSMLRHRELHGDSMPDLGLDQLFSDASDADFQGDLSALTAKLTDLQLDHRVFTATVGMRTARWSE